VGGGDVDISLDDSVVVYIIEMIRDSGMYDMLDALSRVYYDIPLEEYVAMVASHVYPLVRRYKRREAMILYVILAGLYHRSSPSVVQKIVQRITGAKVGREHVQRLHELSMYIIRRIMEGDDGYRVVYITLSEPRRQENG